MLPARVPAPRHVARAALHEGVTPAAPPVDRVKLSPRHRKLAAKRRKGTSLGDVPTHDPTTKPQPQPPPEVASLTLPVAVGHKPPPTPQAAGVKAQVAAVGPSAPPSRNQEAKPASKARKSSKAQVSTQPGSRAAVEHRAGKVTVADMPLPGAPVNGTAANGRGRQPAPHSPSQHRPDVTPHSTREPDVQGFAGWSVFSPPPPSQDSTPSSSSSSSHQTAQQQQAVQAGHHHTTFEALASEQLVALALAWAHELWVAVEAHAQSLLTSHTAAATPASTPAHLMHNAQPANQAPHTQGTSAQLPGTTTATSDHASQVAICAAAPSHWWQQLPHDQQACALANMVALGEEALARLGIMQPAHQNGLVAAHIRADVDDDAVAGRTLQGRATAGVAAAGDGMAALTNERPLSSFVRCGSSTTGHMDHMGHIVPRYTQVGSGRSQTSAPPVSHGACGLSRQQHADITWAMAHLASVQPQHPIQHLQEPWATPANKQQQQYRHLAAPASAANNQQQDQRHQQQLDQQQMQQHHANRQQDGLQQEQQQHEQEQQQQQRHQQLYQDHQLLLLQLQRALGVPFCVLPLVLPGLSVDGFEREVVLGRDTIWLDGGTRAVEEPRLTGWQSEIGATFRYSQKEMQPQPGGLSPCVEQVRDVLQGLTHERYDSILINLYPDGRCGMRYHADPLYGCWTPETSVVSVGHSRKFVFRETRDHSVRWSYTVRNGDVVVMFGDCQDRLQHSVITESTYDMGPRISLVYKQRLPGTLEGEQEEEEERPLMAAAR